MSDEIKVVKVSNAYWLGLIAPQIEKYVKSTALPNMPYEAFFTFVQQIAQTGMGEVAVALDNNKPIGFAVWFMFGLPKIATAHFEAIYVWENNKEAAPALYKEFIKYAKARNAVYLEWFVRSKALVKLFTQEAEQNDIEVNEANRIHIIAKRRK